MEAQAFIQDRRECWQEYHGDSAPARAASVDELWTQKEIESQKGLTARELKARGLSNPESELSDLITMGAVRVSVARGALVYSPDLDSIYGKAVFSARR